MNNVIVENYSYDVFGAPTIYDVNYTEISSSAIGNPYMFTARRADDETALYYYRARYYAFDIGRFLQTDPVGYFDSMNLYSYCGNNPTGWIDPWGNSTIRIYNGTLKTTLVDPTMEEFRLEVQKYSDGTIDMLTISGHGNREAMVIVKGRDPSKGSLFTSLDPDLNVTDVHMSDNLASFTDFIRPKLSENATIQLDGCNTARERWVIETKGGDNISRRLSQRLPGVTVKGNRGFGVGNELFGIKLGRETHVLGFKQTYYTPRPKSDNSDNGNKGSK